MKSPTAKRWQTDAEIDQKKFDQFIKDVKATMESRTPKELTAAALRHTDEICNCHDL